MAARRGVAPFALAAVLLAVAFVATYLFFVRTYVGQIVDERAFVGASGQHDAVYRVAGLVLGNVPTVAVGGGILVTLIIGIVTRRFRHLTVALGVGAVAVAAAELAKHVFLERAATGATDLLDNSFPSGHATVAAAAAFAVFVVSPPRWRPLAAALGGAFAVLTGIGLVIQQWHRPSDVVAAFMLVAACGCLGGIALLLWRVPEAVPPARSLRALWWVSGASAVASAIAFVVIFVTVENHGSHLQIAYAGGSTAILAVGSAFAAAGNSLFRRIS
ncbi:MULTISPECIES: phosphatase PAP2 family protein [unclassified Microbacterium]|uniref:phosphatase PAP2 family protein n=1 Tax=unclassified Microbacterium TaxID=2609290 RepID=UPI001D950FE8|nr:phosphatase PAP2 family protein [Microbacterium sp. USTB-Y]MBS1898183.1 phosphatase PAP2 family protein [Actinomycetota bacterium]